jgi:hypothetical protein
MSTALLRLIASPDRKKPGAFSAYLETGDALVAGSRQPLVDGARELLARGFDPSTLLTMRHEGKSYDSFQPLPIGEWAKWTHAESEERSLRRGPWMPFPAPRSGQKSGSEPLEVPEGHQTENRFHGAAPQQPSTVLAAA